MNEIFPFRDLYLENKICFNSPENNLDVILYQLIFISLVLQIHYSPFQSNHVFLLCKAYLKISVGKTSKFYCTVSESNIVMLVSVSEFMNI